MSDIKFYHLQKQTLDQALPLILEKAYSANHRILVKMSDPKEVERMNAHLWSFKPDTFLPHGFKKTGQVERQPIWLTHTDENPNTANVLVLTQSQTEENLEGYTHICEMLDGHDNQAISDARERWKAYTAAGHNVTYWVQSETGKWEKKA